VQHHRERRHEAGDEAKGKHAHGDIRNFRVKQMQGAGSRGDRSVRRIARADPRPAVKSPYPGSSVGPFLAHRNARHDGLAQRPQTVMSILHTVGRPLHRRRLVCPRGPGVLAPEDPGQPEMFRRQEGRWIERQPIGRLSFGKSVPSPASVRRLREPPLGRRRIAIERPRTTAPADGLRS
jgi:hypothetical protein